MLEGMANAGNQARGIFTHHAVEAKILDIAGKLEVVEFSNKGEPLGRRTHERQL